MASRGCEWATEARGVRRLFLFRFARLARLNLRDLRADGDERVAEAIKLRLVLRLGRLDLKWRGKGNGRRHVITPSADRLS